MGVTYRVGNGAEFAHHLMEAPLAQGVDGVGRQFVSGRLYSGFQIHPRGSQGCAIGGYQASRGQVRRACSPILFAVSARPGQELLGCPAVEVVNDVGLHRVQIVAGKQGHVGVPAVFAE